MSGKNAGKPSLYCANTFFRRLLGLNSRRAREFDGIWISPCRSVHTIGFSHRIDIYFLDSSFRVIKTVLGMRKNSLAGCLRAKSVIEILSSKNAYHWNVGDIVDV